MKLLGWMHSKFRQGNGDAFRDYSIGSTCNCLTGMSKDEQQYSPVIISPIATNSRSLKEQDISYEDTLLFEGLLSIGTLGIQPIQEEEEEEEEEEYMQEDEVEQSQEYETKTTLKAIAEKEENEMTSESELMAVNKELEKVLTEAADMEGNRMSSARPSHFTGNVNEACPLQEFLFGAAAVVDVGSEKKKKEKRASLVELFMTEEGNDVKKEKKGEDGGKKGNKLTKMLLKRSEGKVGGGDVDGAGGGAGKDASVKTAKFNKILRIFNKKIHPDNDMATPKKQAKYSSKYKSKQAKESSSISSNVFCNRCSILSADGSDSVDSSEHWIKTDADFLVLEIQKGITSAAD